MAASDDGRPVANAAVMQRVWNLLRLDLPVISHCEDLDIIDGGIINKGAVSGRWVSRAWIAPARTPSPPGK